MRTFTHRLWLLALPLAAVMAVGCEKEGPAAGKTILKGKLVKGGEPYALDQSKVKLPKGGTAMPPGISTSSVLQVVLISADGKDQYTAKTNSDTGTFEVAGPDGKGIAPGRYKIAVTAKVGLSPSDPDLFGGRYAADKTQILRDIKDGEDVVIDVSKPQG